MPKKPSVLIVGAGAVGLSTAIHLKRAGYESVTVVDEQEYDKNHYSPIRADCDAASADLNKIVRSSYGGYKNGAEYQKLAMEAMHVWDEWNRELENSKPGQFGPLTANDVLFSRCGYLRLRSKPELGSAEVASLQNSADLGQRSQQYVLNDQEDERRAAAAGISEKLRPFPPGVAENAVLDLTSGFAYADKACTFALHLAEQLGVTFYLGPQHRLLSLLETAQKDGSTHVRGIATPSGQHHADFTILACGSWTPSILPKELAGLLEATAGSVTVIQIDDEDLRKKYGPERFVVWTAIEHGGQTAKDAEVSEFEGLYGFPVTPDGLMKFGFRGTKYTNFADNPEVSTPRTVRTRIPETRIVASAFRPVERFISRYMPDLVGKYRVWGTRLCWYTDSPSNDWLFDHVPGKEGLLVASGGSGHLFKFLPTVGQHVVAALERRRTPYSHMFCWREGVKPGQAPVNGIGEGRGGPRELLSQELTPLLAKL